MAGSSHGERLPAGMVANVISDPMPGARKPCPYCGHYDGHDWDWRHRATTSAGLAVFGVVVAFLGLLTGADQLNYFGLAVVPRQVADTVHGRAADRGVVSMMVVAVEPGRQGPVPLAL